MFTLYEYCLATESRVSTKQWRYTYVHCPKASAYFILIISRCVTVNSRPVTKVFVKYIFWYILCSIFNNPRLMKFNLLLKKSVAIRKKLQDNLDAFRCYRKLCSSRCPTTNYNFLSETYIYPLPPPKNWIRNSKMYNNITTTFCLQTKQKCPK